ncbi:MAG: lipocalin family protein [Silicimonas sp.]|nr:lipocalin family protein [Silicimonas sp.]
MRRALAFLCLLLAGCAGGYRDTSVGMTSMAVFDPARYAGTWYEVASFPTPFQRGCTDTRAEYAVRADGALSVRNTCLKDGAVSVIGGEAQIVGPGRLKVRLDGVPVQADYWVLWVDEGYRTAAVGVPSGRAGWILNRTETIPPDRLKAAREVLRFNGYDVSALQMTPQGVQ